MSENPFKVAVGLMSGTSLDGIDAALIETDGETIRFMGDSLTLPYDAAFRETLKGQLGNLDVDPTIVQTLTLHHATAVKQLLARSGIEPQKIDVIGFHGHTIWHRPEKGETCQIGDGARLAVETGIPVVGDMRSADVAAGGEGAPLAPALHAALSEFLEKPLAVLNIGGVSNVTWIGYDDQLVAFDTGPGNALIDDWIKNKTGKLMDENGKLAASGQVDDKVLTHLMDNAYFDRPYPKSLDRDAFSLESLSELNDADGAATLVAFTAASVAKAAQILPSMPKRWLITGGGRHNYAIMDSLRKYLARSVDPVEIVGWQGDALEAQAFGFLAVRSLRGLPLTFPGTTGVSRPEKGGVLYKVRAN